MSSLMKAQTVSTGIADLSHKLSDMVNHIHIEGMPVKLIVQWTSNVTVPHFTVDFVEASEDLSDNGPIVVPLMRSLVENGEWLVEITRHAGMLVAPNERFIVAALVGFIGAHMVTCVPPVLLDTKPYALVPTLYRFPREGETVF